MISWIDSDDDSDAQISLYYDSDSHGYDGTLIAQGISEDQYGDSGAYIWDTSLLVEGEYYIYAEISDGENNARDYSSGAVAVSHNGTFNTAPAILEISPLEGEDAADENYTIRWLDLDPDDDAQISLYYDTDQVGYDGTLIVSGISEDDETDFFVWNTEDVPEGRYFIYGTISDGTNNPVHDYSHGTLLISHTTVDDGDVEDEQGLDWLLLCFIFLPVLILFLFLILYYRTRKEKNRLDHLISERISEQRSQEESQDISVDEPVREPASEDDEIDEDLLPMPEDDVQPPPPD
jgi:hypothetical protein